jgi:hypothetical protein
VRTPPEKIDALRKLGVFKRSRSRQEYVYIIRRGKVCLIPYDLFHMRSSHFETWLKTDGSKRLLPTDPVHGRRDGRAWNLGSKRRRVPPERQKIIWLTYPLDPDGRPLGRGRWWKWDRWEAGGKRGRSRRRFAQKEMYFGAEDYARMLDEIDNYDWYYDDWEDDGNGFAWKDHGWSVTFLDLMR